MTILYRESENGALKRDFVYCWQDALLLFFFGLVGMFFLQLGRERKRPDMPDPPRMPFGYPWRKTRTGASSPIIVNRAEEIDLNRQK